MNEDVITWLEVKQQNAEIEVEGCKRAIAALKESKEAQKYKEAQEYRTPRKVKRTIIYGDCQCPRCGFELYTVGVNRFKYEAPFCSRCGQALDWTED